jgi:hypothetical protein
MEEEEEEEEEEEMQDASTLSRANRCPHRHTAAIHVSSYSSYICVCAY